jgi:hypothetical protein
MKDKKIKLLKQSEITLEVMKEQAKRVMERTKGTIKKTKQNKSS